MHTYKKNTLITFGLLMLATHAARACNGESFPKVKFSNDYIFANSCKNLLKWIQANENNPAKIIQECASIIGSIPLGKMASQTKYATQQKLLNALVPYLPGEINKKLKHLRTKNASAVIQNITCLLTKLPDETLNNVAPEHQYLHQCARFAALLKVVARTPMVLIPPEQQNYNKK